jgi:catechol 2,3-dioxygenase-like lactoylglutathione lyase family enzyme
VRLNHADLYVADLADARRLFEELLDFKVVDQKGDVVLILSDGEGFTLAVTDHSNAAAGRPEYPKGFHLGFFVKSRAEVDATYTRLTAAGIDAGRGPRTIRNSYGFYFTALDGILFEIACLAPAAA